MSKSFLFLIQFKLIIKLTIYLYFQYFIYLNIEYNNNIDNIKKSLYIEKCDNLKIKVYDKINHIKIINCENISLAV